MKTWIGFYIRTFKDQKDLAELLSTVQLSILFQKDSQIPQFLLKKSPKLSSLLIKARPLGEEPSHPNFTPLLKKSQLLTPLYTFKHSLPVSQLSSCGESTPRQSTNLFQSDSTEVFNIQPNGFACAYGKYKWRLSVHVCVCVHMLKMKSNKRAQIKENTYVHRVEKDLPCGWHIKKGIRE